MNVPFAAWYSAVNGREPFPWQDRLAQQVAAGGWPDAIGVPTGLGKTACLDIAVWALAQQADRPATQRSARTRIWWVVNRRALVDDTHEHAEDLKRKLADPQRSLAIQQVASALRRIAGDDSRPPLEVWKLRGGEPKGRPSLPSQPAIICSTVPMYGSRLLFRGYGASRSLWPIDAALAGTDSLVLMDEAHLATGLRHVIDRANKFQSTATDRVSERDLSVVPVSITATADASQSVFDIDASDEKNTDIHKRLNAPKKLVLRSATWTTSKQSRTQAAHDGSIEDPEDLDKPEKIADHILKATKTLLAKHPNPVGTVLVFVNSPRTAKHVCEKLSGLNSVETCLATGQSREREANQARRTIREWLNPKRDRTEREEGAATRVVVATQTLEVGADLDADHLVTESCGVQSLIQRLGRLNRMGHRKDSTVTYVHDPKDNNRPIYGAEPNDIWDHFIDLSGVDPADLKAGKAVGIDLSPASLRNQVSPSVLPPPTPPPQPGDFPVLHKGVLDVLTRTSVTANNETPVSVFYDGCQPRDRTVNLVWRTHIPDIAPDDPVRLWPPVDADEIVAVPVWSVRDALSNVEGLAKVGAAGTLERVASVEGELRFSPGQTVIVPAGAGRLDTNGMWAPESSDIVLDMSLEHALPLREEAIEAIYSTNGVPLEVRERMDPLRSLLTDDPWADLLEEADRDQLIEELLTAIEHAGPAQHETGESLNSIIAEFAATANNLMTHGWVLLDKDVCYVALDKAVATKDVFVDDDDELSAAGSSEPLEQHQSRTADVAGDVAEALGLNTGIANMLHLAANSHDAGKADERFQRWLGEGTAPSTVLGKSATPRHKWNTFRAGSGWPRGGRHEELSRRLVQQYLTTRTDLDNDLVLHLVVSHHGKGRPLLLGLHPQHASPADHHVQWTIEGVDCTASASLSDTDWTQPERFHALCEKFGPWGLCLLEAVLRQSDHKVS